MTVSGLTAVKKFHFQGNVYIPGTASGPLLSSNLELSFWGGVNPQTGAIIDRHHTLSGRFLQDTILAIPGGRGSCSGSGVLLELLLNNKGPAAMIFQRREDILTLGVMIAEEIFSKAIPVVTLDVVDFQRILSHDGCKVYIDGGSVSTSVVLKNAKQAIYDNKSLHVTPVADEMRLSKLDKDFLNGRYGEAGRAAMRIVLRMAALLGATELMDITQAHIDACVYTGPASLAVAEKLRDWGGQVRVPTTLNSISVDSRRWRAQGIDVDLGSAAIRLGKAYTDMGASPTFTCAPYQLDNAPKLGDQIAWAESNAVVYANSVLGARTMKYPDFLDIAIALTGRAPKGGPHIEINRRATVVVRLTELDEQSAKAIDDSFYPLLGYHVGGLSSSEIPVVVGMKFLAPSNDDLKAFGAAFATVSGAPMFHIVGVTPEATSLSDVVGAKATVRTLDVKLKDLAICWESLNSRVDHQQVDLVSLGNPHFSFSEIKKLTQLCSNRKKVENIAVMVTCGRATYGLASQAGYIGKLEDFGVQVITDTCWCMITEPLISSSATTIITNSGKYAHYGPGITGKDFYFASLAGCVDAACGSCPGDLIPLWLRSTSHKM